MSLAKVSSPQSFEMSSQASLSGQNNKGWTVSVPVNLLTTPRPRVCIYAHRLIHILTSFIPYSFPNP